MKKLFIFLKKLRWLEALIYALIVQFIGFAFMDKELSPLHAAYSFLGWIIAGFLIDRFRNKQISE